MHETIFQSEVSFLLSHSADWCRRAPRGRGGEVRRIAVVLLSSDIGDSLPSEPVPPSRIRAMGDSIQRRAVVAS